MAEFIWGECEAATQAHNTSVPYIHIASTRASAFMVDFN